MDETVLYICKNCKKICSGNYFEVSVNKNICPSCKTEKGLKRLNISVEKWRSLSSEQKKEEKEKLILEIESEAEKELENQRRENELKEQQQLRASLFADVGYHGRIITTSNCVEGFKIKRYLGVYSGANVIHTPGGWIGEGITDKKQTIYINDSIKKCIDLLFENAPTSTDAIIGMQNSITIINDNGQKYLVTIFGTAVELEKITNDNLNE